MKKRFLSMLLAIVMVVGMIPGMSLAASAAESLTDSTTGVILADSDGDDYYEVDTPDKLVAFANLVNAGNDSINIELTDDIDMTGKEWSMIVYGGIINGNEHTVSNLTFVATEAEGEQYAGLIYAYDATVKNITFENCRTVINSTTSSERDIYAAIIAPVAIGGIFENCSLVGCTVTQSGIASGFSYAGSLAGLTAYGLKITDCSVENCTVTDDSESADGSFAGGLAGGFWADEAAYDFGVQVKNNTINADVTAKNSPGVDAASGLVCSVLDDSLAIVQVYDNCTVDGTIIADDVAAGLIGDCIGYDMTISNCTVLCDSISAAQGDPFAYGEWAQKGEHDYYTMTYSDLKISENTEFVCKQFENTLGKYYLSDLYADGAFDADIVSFADSAAEVSYTVTVSDSIENGTVVADVSEAAEGDTVTLTVTPATGYELDTLTVGGDDVTDEVADGEYAFTMPASNVTVTATFKETASAADLLISSVTELVAFAEAVNGGNSYEGKVVKLTKSLDLSGIEWTPIGETGAKFMGTFDGGYHVIDGLTIESDTGFTGFFGKVEDATIKNLGIVNAVVSSSDDDTAILAANTIGGSIENCFVTGKASGYAGVGGIIGSTHGYSNPTTVKNCYVRATLEYADARGDCAGIAGWNYSSSIKIINSYSACIGEVRPIAGWSDGADVANSNFENVYFDKDLSPDFSSTAGRTDLGRTSEELQNEDTFENYDFTSIWDIDPDINGGYPYLRGFDNVVLSGAPGTFTVILTDENGDAVTDADVVITSDSATITLVHQGGGVYSASVPNEEAEYSISVNDDELATSSHNGTETLVLEYQVMSSTPAGYTVTFMNGGSVFATIPVAEGNTLAMSGMPIPDMPAGATLFGGWYNEDGDFVYHGMTVTSDMTAYPTWITVETDGNGTVSVQRDSADLSKMIITATPNEGYALDSLAVSDASGNIDVSDNKFTKPASDVTVSATFKAVVTSHSHCYCGGSWNGHTCNDLEYISITKLSEITAPGNYYIADGFTLGYFDRTISASGTVNLCLNGKSVTYNSAMTVASGTTVNICDCSSDESGTLGCNITNKGTLNLYGGKIGGQIENYQGAALNIYGGSVDYSGYHAIINNGTLKVYGGSVTAGGTDYAVENNAEMLIKGGTFESKGNVCIDNDATNVTIEGGTFIASGSNSTIRNNGNSTMEITGGTFIGKGENTGAVLTVCANSTTTVSGGTFTGGGTVISNRGTLDISDGLFTSIATDDAKYVIDTTAGLSISGGTFVHHNKEASVFAYRSSGADAPISLTGGTFKNGIELTSQRGTGYTTSYLSDILAEGYCYYQNSEVLILDSLYQTFVTGGDVSVAEEPDVEIYTITFDANEGTVSTASAQTNLNCKLGSLPTPTRDHYTFEGWFTAKEDGTQVTVDTVYSSDRTLYARWTPETYTITYILYDGLTDEDTYSYGEDVVLPKDASRDGYRFSGWYMDSEYTRGPYGKISQSSVDFTFYAKWTKEYSVTVQTAENGIVSADISKAIENEIVTLTITPASGYDLADISVTAAVDTDIPLSGEGYKFTFAMPAGDVTVTAVFEPAKVTFNNNNGSGSMEAVTVTDSTGLYTLPECGFTAPATTVPGGMIFAGWSYSADGEVIADDVITVTKNTELFAIWKYSPNLNQTIEKSGVFNKQHTFNIDLGALLPPDAKIKQSAGITSSGIAVETTTPSYTVGTCNASLEIVTRITEVPTSDTVIMTLDTENYGKFTFTVNITLTGYIIEYVLDGGIVDTPNPKAYSPESDTFTLINPTRSGYTFKGWSGTELTGDENTSVTIPTGSTGDRTYTANWTVNKYTITFNTDGGTEVAPITQNYGTAITAPVNPTKVGYNFDKWEPEIPATMPAGNMTVKALWIEKDDVSIETGTQTYTFDGQAKTFAITGNVTDGFTVSYEQEGRAAEPVNAGTYDVVITRAEDDVYKAYSVTLPDALVIDPKPITRPAQADAVIYNGTAQTYGVPATAYYTVTNNVKTDANEDGYNVTVALTDKENTVWDNGSVTDLTHKFVILRKAITEVSGVAAPVAEGIPEATVSGDNYSGRAEWTPEADKFGYYTEYAVKITLTSDSNHKFADDIALDGYSAVVTDNNSVLTLEKTFERTAKAKILSVTPPTVDKLAVYGTLEDALSVMPTSIVVVTEEGGTTLPISWEIVGSYDMTPEVTNTFKWTADIGNYDANGQTISNTLGVVNADALGVVNTASPAVITYDTSTFDVSSMFNKDTNAGEESYRIVVLGIENEGAGTLGEDGKTLTVTKAGIITVEMYTAPKEAYDEGSVRTTLTVNLGIGTASVTVDDYTYGDDASVPAPVSSTNGTDNVTYIYESTDGKGYNSSVAPTEAGEYKVTATFAATDLYGKVTAEDKFTVIKALPTVNKLPKASDVRKYRTLGTSDLKGGIIFGADGEAIDGTFAWKTPDIKMNTVGEYEMTVVFTPDDTENYEIIEFDVAVEVYSIVGEIAVSLEKENGGKYHTVSFDSDGGSEIDEQKVKRGTSADEPEAPEKEGFTFDGWYLDEECTVPYDFETGVKEDITLFAKWTENKPEEPEVPEAPDVCDGTAEDNCPSLMFTDLNTSEWYHLDIDYVLENGIMNGMGEGIFAPNGTTTRAMIVTVIWRLEGKPIVNYLMQFEDVAADTWYTEAVRWAASEGIVKGYSDTAFGPDDAITREQLAAILYRYADYKEYDVGASADLTRYTDADKVSDWALDALKWANAEEIVNGMPGDILAPAGNATRAQAAAMIHRFFEKIK